MIFFAHTNKRFLFFETTFHNHFFGNAMMPKASSVDADKPITPASKTVLTTTEVLVLRHRS